MSRQVIVKAREQIAEVARVATRPIRRGQNGGSVCSSWQDSNCPGFDTTPGARGASIHLHPVSEASPDRAGGRTWALATNNGDNCLCAWHCR